MGITFLEEMVSEDASDEDIMTAMQENELIVRMPPIKKYKIKAKVKSIKKASLRIVEPEEIDEERISLV
jgi:hypothetical protein